MGFLKNKFSDVSVGSLLFGELEAFVYWLIGSIPGIGGILLRNGAFLFLLGKKKGIFWVQHHVTIVNGNKMTVGRNCAVNTGTYINAKGGISMGDYVLIGSNVTLSSGKHPIEGVEPSVYERPTIPMKITIEDDVWIGANVVVMPGVTIKKGTVVGAGSVVTKDTEEYSVVVGAPARVIRYRYEEKNS